MAHNPNDGNNREPRIEMDYYYGCVRVNGILFPQPINYMPVSPPPSPPPQEVNLDHQEQEESSNRGGSRIIETGDFRLELFQREEDHKYILRMHEVVINEREETRFYGLSAMVRSSVEKRRMEAKEISIPHKTMFPITQELFSIAESKFNFLTMKERLDGKWTFHVRQRYSNNKIEKFYFHEKVRKTFRSMNDIATFIMYASE